ncbi:hypothetical protein [Streptomyces canus]|uniref:hypothetical protein n=1 Tax=Streptomyces canus TaxID=58343 RepID=UPI0027D7EDE3|nr:hypothetical protein [Streptomyces canus]
MEKRGGISFSAPHLKQLRTSLLGHADYIQRVHPLMADPAEVEDLMRRAGARQWAKAQP